jgi:hypothetical protein
VENKAFVGLERQNVSMDVDGACPRNIAPRSRTIDGGRRHIAEGLTGTQGMRT